ISCFSILWIRLFLTTPADPLSDRSGDFGHFLNQCVQEGGYIAASGKTGTLPGPHRHEVRYARRCCRDRKVSDHSSLQWIRQDLGPSSIQLLHQAVLDSSGQPARETLCQSSVSSSLSPQSFAMNGRRAGFLARQERCSHLDGLSAE